MAKLPEPYQCDVAPCASVKGAASHWFLLRTMRETPGFLLMPWDADVAREARVLHICSEECAQKALAKWLTHPDGARAIREITHK